MFTEEEKIFILEKTESKKNQILNSEINKKKIKKNFHILGHLNSQKKNLHKKQFQIKTKCFSAYTIKSSKCSFNIPPIQDFIFTKFFEIDSNSSSKNFNLTYNFFDSKKVEIKKQNLNDSGETSFNSFKENIFDTSQNFFKNSNNFLTNKTLFKP